MTHLAMVFPGGYHHGEDPHARPLATVVTRSLEQAGAVVEHVTYDDLLDHDKLLIGVRRDIARALDSHQPDCVTFVAKSLGTQALALACREFTSAANAGAIWLTPIWHWDNAWAAARACSWPALHIVGLADSYHSPERHAELPGTTVAIEGADHSLEIPGDILRTLDAWHRVSESILSFVTAPPTT